MPHCTKTPALVPFSLNLTESFALIRIAYKGSKGGQSRSFGPGGIIIIGALCVSLKEPKKQTRPGGPSFHLFPIPAASAAALAVAGGSKSKTTHSVDRSSSIVPSLLLFNGGHRFFALAVKLWERECGIFLFFYLFQFDFAKLSFELSRMKKKIDAFMHKLEGNVLMITSGNNA